MFRGLREGETNRLAQKTEKGGETGKKNEYNGSP